MFLKIALKLGTRDMRPISVLCTVLRLLLLFSAVLVCLLISYHGSPRQLLSGPTLTPTMPSTPVTAHSTQWDGREPHIDPVSLLNSPGMSSVDEKLREIVQKRLSSKLARFATAGRYKSSLSPTANIQSVSVRKRLSHTVSKATEQDVVTDSTTSGSSSDRGMGNAVQASLTDGSRGEANIKGRSLQVHKDSIVTKNPTSVAPEPHSSSISHVNSPTLVAPHTAVAALSVGRDYHWPQPQAVRPLKDLMAEQWMADLQSCVRRMTSHEVTLLTSNQPYTEVLLNWLVAAVARASVDLSQVLVIAMDHTLHSLLAERGINSVLVRPASLLTASALKEGVFPSVMMTRLSIIRLLNHWGCDVFNYDTDAVLLHDPSQLLQLHSEDDIIGTFGRFPTDLTKKWGITLCTAMLVVRSSTATEEFWEVMSRAAPKCYSDQGKMNYGLQAMDVQWSLPSRKLASLSQSVQGVCRNGLSVSLLPYTIACRAGSCTRRALASGLYIWHKGGARVGARKRQGAEVGGVWFVRSDWSVGCNNRTGRDWIKCISTTGVFTS